MYSTSSLEPEKILKSLESLNDRQKSYKAQAFCLAQDSAQKGFEKVSRPRLVEHSISVHRDIDRRLTHVHKTCSKRSSGLQSLTCNYEGVDSNTIGKGLICVNSKNSIKNFSLGIEDCKNLTPKVLPWGISPEDLYIKFSKFGASETFAKRLVSFFRRNRENLRWIKLTLKGNNRSKFFFYREELKLINWKIS